MKAESAGKELVGKDSALTVLGNVCKEKLSMPIEFVAQNGAEIHEVRKIGVTGCGKAHKVKRHRKAGKHGKKRKK